MRLLDGENSVGGENGDSVLRSNSRTRLTCGRLVDNNDAVRMRKSRAIGSQTVKEGFVELEDILRERLTSGNELQRADDLE